MLLKLQIQLSTVICILLCGSYLIMESHAYCSLEKMKEFAMEACEHLFLQDEPSRERRSLDYGVNGFQMFGSMKASNKKHLNYSVRRSIYPQGGYLKVGRSHYMRLSNVDVMPKYKANKHAHVKDLHMDTKERFKREHYAMYNHLPYCCYNNCDEDFFC